MLSWRALLGIVILAIGALVLVFPRKDLITLLRSEAGADNRELTVAYLRNIIRTEPKDIGLRLLLVEKLMDAGDLEGARLSLTDARLLAGTSLAAQETWDRWDLLWWQARLREARKLGREAQRLQAASELLSRIQRRTASVTTPAQVFASIQSARDLQAELVTPGSAKSDANGDAKSDAKGDAKSTAQDAVKGGSMVDEALRLQHQLLERLLTLPASGVADLARGARLALEDARFQLASDLFFAARRKTQLPEQRYTLLQQGVRALLAGGQPREAWQAAVRESKPLDPGNLANPADPATQTTWWWLAELALAASEPREAALALRNVVSLNDTAAHLAKSLSAERLQIAWATFAAANDLPAALKMTEAALLAQPQSALWLERKAQVAEWSGLAPLALAAWLELMKSGANRQALANVFRLSPMVYDDTALLAAWVALSRQRRLSEAEVDKVIDVYERLGSVDATLAFVRQLRAQTALNHANANASANSDSDSVARLLGIEAKLLAQAGRPKEAIAVLEQLRLAGLAKEDALRLAFLYLKQGNPSLALRALQSARPGADGAGGTGAVFDSGYWSLLADLAYDAGERAVARDALDLLIARGKPESYQAERAIRIRLDTNQTAQALALAAQLYPRFPEDRILYAWLDVIDTQKNPSGLRDLLAALSPDQRQKLERSPSFLERRAGLFQRLSDIPLALLDYQQALALRPGHSPTRLSYWWLLVDQKDRATLRAELARAGRTGGTGRSDVTQDEAFSDVRAAAWQLLDQPQMALAAMQPVARKRANDFLWLMNYADMLDRSGRASQALRVRRHAWFVASRAVSQPRDFELGRQALIAQLRLAADFAGGEQKSRLWRELGQMLNGATPSSTAASATVLAGQPSVQLRQAQELVGSWLLSEGRFDAAARWLWQLHAARVAAPSYQQLAVALAQNDVQALVRLLDQSDGAIAARVSGKLSVNGVERLGEQDRLSALRQLDLRDQAATLGFELAQRRPEGEGDEAQRALQDDLLANASRFSVQERTRNAGVLTRQEIRANAAIAISPALKFTLELGLGRDRSNNLAQIAATPAHDRELRLGIETQTTLGAIKAQWAVRDALATVQGALLQLTTRLGSRSVLQLEAALGERSDESSAMSVAGKRDRAAATLNLRANEQLDGQARFAVNRFSTQTGAGLGHSVDAALTGNWTLRRDYPDVRLQSHLRRSVVAVTGQPDAATAFLQPGGSVPGAGLFLGPSSTALSFSLGVGLTQGDPRIYSRAWRPWGEVGFETRQTQGNRQTQGLLRFGAKGSVVGRDQLSVNLEVRPGSGGLSGADATRELRVQYDLFFDR